MRAARDWVPRRRRWARRVFGPALGLSSVVTSADRRHGHAAAVRLDGRGFVLRSRSRRPWCFRAAPPLPPGEAGGGGVGGERGSALPPPPPPPPSRGGGG